MQEHAPTPDHDLLIQVNTNVINLTTSLQAYTTQTSGQMQDHESRLRVEEALSQQTMGAQKSIRNLISLISIIGVIFDIALGIFVMVKH
ncbi:hypothetical protein [Subtercola sp. RTI3]|uniref:hypothetical protein n=1 Tax=Subtercola sp. RTI3 TaxID=3048639 RepID=UPI002B2353A1|nr:hypothetical protein [Subtercola sp. RTI3]MEA9986264.1 hypothetical protein [Subtercola sp. RTI3]